jgi:hypothetical protein
MLVLQNMGFTGVHILSIMGVIALIMIIPYTFTNSKN